MNLLPRLACLGALVLAPFSVACGHVDEGDTGATEDHLNVSIANGTFVIDMPPFAGGNYLSRITFTDGRYDADLVKSDGDTLAISGPLAIIQSRPADEDSPVIGNKPALVLESDTGVTTFAFDFDKISNNELRLYGSGRQTDFRMTRDTSVQPVTGNAKVINCTGPTVNARLTVDDRHRGSLVITRNATADRHDAPAGTVTMGPDEFAESDDSVYLQGRKDQRDYYANMDKDAFERGTGSITVNLRWAEDGQELSFGRQTCSFAR